MAKKSTDEYLAGILNLLDDIIKENKKATKDGGSPNAAMFTADAKNIKAVGDSLKVLSSAILPIAKITDKDLDRVTNTIKNLADAIQSISIDKQHIDALQSMVGLFNQMSQVIDKMSEGFFKSFFKFGPIRAHLIGKRMARFYKIILKYLAGAMAEVMNPLSAIGNVDGMKEKIDAMSSLTKLMLFDVKPADLKKILEMGIVLTEKRGRGIAKFYTGLINELSKVDPDGKTTKNATKLVKQITRLIGMLTISLIAIVALVMIAPPEKVIAGFLLLTTLVVGSYFLMKALASNKFKKLSKNMSQSLVGITVLILGLTVSLVLLTLIASKFEPKEILGGMAILAGVVLFAVGIMLVLSKKGIKKSSKESLITVAGIILLFMGLSLTMFITAELGKKAKEVLAGGLLVVGFTIVSVFLIKMLARVKKSTLIKGLISAALIAVMIASISGAMLVFGEFLNKLNGLENKTILWGIGLTVAMVVGMGAIAFAAGGLIMGPQAALFFAGFAAIEIVATMIASVSGAMLLFAKLLNKIKELSKDDIKDAIDKFTSKDGLISALSQIVAGLAKFGVKAAAKVGIISVAIRPVISTISQFVDVVQKMASLKIADEWDKDGKPTHYLQLKPEAFKEAAANLTSAFSTFLTDLNKGLEGFDLKSIAVINLLFPRQSKMSKWLTGEKPGIGAVIHMLSDFIDVIQKMGSLSVPDKWDKDGKPIGYRQLTTEEFGTSAITLATAFGKFVSELGVGLEDVSLKAAIALKILSGPLSELLPSIGSIISPIMQIATGKMAVGNEVLDLKLEDMKKAGSDIVKVIQNVINPLQDLSTKGIDEDDIKEIMNSFTYAMDSFEKYANSFVFKEDFKDKAKFATSGLYIFGNFLQMTSYLKTAQSNAKVLKDTLKYTSDGLNYIVPLLKSTPEQIKDLANAMKELDIELIEKEEKRTEALQSISSNFKDMSASINKLNNSLAESMRLSKLYNALKENTTGRILQSGMGSVVEATSMVAERVEKAITGESKKEEQKKLEAEKQQQDRDSLAMTIGAAIQAAMHEYFESHKDITVSLGDGTQKIFGEVYGG